MSDEEIFSIIRTSSWSSTPYFVRISFFTISRSARTSWYVAFASFIKKFPCCSLTLTPQTRAHLSPALSMSLPDESVPIGVRNSSSESICSGVGTVFIKNEPHENPDGCFTLRIDFRFSGVYVSYSPQRDERSMRVDMIKYPGFPLRAE